MKTHCQYFGIGVSNAPVRKTALEPFLEKLTDIKLIQIYDVPIVSRVRRLISRERTHVAVRQPMLDFGQCVDEGSGHSDVITYRLYLNTRASRAPPCAPGSETSPPSAASRFLGLLSTASMGLAMSLAAALRV